MNYRLLCALIMILCRSIDQVHSEQINNENILNNHIGGNLNVVPNHVNVLKYDTQSVATNELSDASIRYQREFLRQDLIQLLFEQVEGRLATKCSQSLNDFKLNLNNGSIWAFKMYDASSRQISGLLDGTFLNLGSFQECLRIKNESTGFIAKYFLINLVPILDASNEGISLNELQQSNSNLKSRLSFLFRFPDHVNVKVGLCLPHLCENNEIQELLNRTVNQYHWKIQKAINSQTNENLWSKLRSSGGETKVAFCIIVSLLSLVFISTIVDLIFKPKKDASILYTFVESTSIRSNFRKLHSSDMSGHTNNFVAKNRYYSEIMVNITHFIVFVPLLSGSVINENIFDWLHLTDKFYYGFLWTDCYYPSLLLLAAMSVSLKMFSMIQKQATGRELIKNAFRRMVSFWPILIVLISIQICMPIFIDGPLVKELITPLAKNCETHYMLNLLFINNYIPLQSTCLPYTWTISSELQFYLIVSLLTFLYINKKVLALGLNILLILIGFFSNVYVVYTNLTRPNVVFLQPFSYQSLQDSIYYSHSNTLVQFTPYFTLFLAFYLRLTKKSLKISFEKEMLITIWLLIYVTSTFHSSILFNVLGMQTTSPIVNTIYYMYNRSSLTIFAAWMVLQFWPNGTPSKKEKIKEWVAKNLLGKNIDRNETKDGQGLIGEFVDKLNRNLNSDAKEEAKRKVSSSESTSDLSDHLNESFNELIDRSSAQDKNNNKTNEFYNKKLIDFRELSSEKLSDEKSIDEKSIDKNITLDESGDSNEKNIERNKRVNRPSPIMIWIKLSRSIYYSHFFYLSYSLFNVNNPQKSDIFSMVVSIHSKLFWSYILAYVFHLLIEAAVTNLTNKLMELLTTKDKLHKP